MIVFLTWLYYSEGVYRWHYKLNKRSYKNIITIEYKISKNLIEGKSFCDTQYFGVDNFFLTTVLHNLI